MIPHLRNNDKVGIECEKNNDLIKIITGIRRC